MLKQRRVSMRPFLCSLVWDDCGIPGLVLADDTPSSRGLGAPSKRFARKIVPHMLTKADTCQR